MTTRTSSNVTSIYRCGRCRADAPRVDLCLNGEVLDLRVYACSECIAKIEGELANVRPIFDAMIAAGIDRALANEAMTFILDRTERVRP